MNAIPRPLHFCWICSKAVDLSICKIDEHGRAVHENCHLAKMAFNSKSAQKPQQPTNHLLRSAENERKSQDLIEQTRKLLAQSEAIAKKKYRSRWD